jgi:hypothetical protein
VAARWPLLDVQNQSPPHPRWFAAAFSDDAQLLSGKPDRFNAVVTSADVRAVATSVATVFLDPTKAFASYASRTRALTTSSGVRTSTPLSSAPRPRWPPDRPVEPS